MSIIVLAPRRHGQETIEKNISGGNTDQIGIVSVWTPLSVPQPLPRAHSRSVVNLAIITNVYWTFPYAIMKRNSNSRSSQAFGYKKMQRGLH